VEQVTVKALSSNPSTEEKKKKGEKTTTKKFTPIPK
jgi:hypothetical protein